MKPLNSHERLWIASIWIPDSTGTNIFERYDIMFTYAQISPERASELNDYYNNHLLPETGKLPPI